MPEEIQPTQPEAAKPAQEIAEASQKSAVESLTLSKLLKHEKLIGALITTIVVLVFSPISLSLSFYLNQVFSRPFLSVEYAELIINEKPIHLPSDELDDLTSTRSFQAIMMRNTGTFAPLLQAQHNQDGISKAKLGEVKEALSKFITYAADRKKLVMSSQEILSKDQSEEGLRQAYLKYHGAAAQFTGTNDINSARTSLNGQLGREKESLLETERLAAILAAKLDQAKSEGVDSIQFKLSILNRGNTDGLVRNLGELRFPQAKAKFPIKRSSQKKAPNDLAAGAVPVAVLNPEDASHAGAVGKVEKNSMVELWFALDQSSLSPTQIAQAIALVSNSTNSYEIVLLDHANHTVHFRRQ